MNPIVVTAAAAALCVAAAAVNRGAGADAGGVVRIALVSDPHETRSPDAEKRTYRQHFDKVIADVNAARVDVVLVAGDLTDGGLPDQVADFKAQIRGFSAPVRCVYGNHDLGQKVGVMDKDGKPEKGAVTPDRIARFEAALGPSYWSEKIAGVRVIGMDTPVLGSGLPSEAAQWAFLERELSPKRQGDAPPTVVVTHYPLYTERPDEPGGVYWNVEPAPRARLLALLDGDHTVRAVLSGHLHHGLTQARGGVLLYSTPPVSFGLPKGKQPEGWTLVTVPKDPSLPVRAEFRPVVPPVPPDAPAAPGRK